MSSKSRRIVNFQALALSANRTQSIQANFVTEYLDDLAGLDLNAQMMVFARRNLGVVVSPHGSGLTWILFMPRGSVVVEIFPPNSYMNKTDYFDIAKARGVKYHKWAGHSRGDNIVVDESTFLPFLVKVCGEQIKKKKEFLGGRAQAFGA